MISFESVRFEKDQAEASRNIRIAAENLEVWLDSEIVHCRELSLALTKLEECIMWANKAIAKGHLTSRL